VGKLADIAVLSDDIFRVKPEDIKKLKVMITIFDGKVIYEKRL
jgi:predicted amidohydrolase YtcJ